MTQFQVPDNMTAVVLDSYSGPKALRVEHVAGQRLQGKDARLAGPLERRAGHPQSSRKDAGRA